MNVREQLGDLVGRVRLLLGVFYLLLAVVAGGFWFVQVAQGSYYRELAENNRLRKRPIQAPRGLITDRNHRLLVENIPSYDLLLDRSSTNDEKASIAFAAEVLGRSSDELTATLQRGRSQPSFKPIPLASELDLSDIARLQVESLEHPEFEIAVRHVRLYRQGSQTAHALGYLGEVTEQELADDPQHYTSGDLVGRKGVELTYDARLRGTDGERVVVVDSRGKPLDERVQRPALPGDDLRVTLDLGLQQEAERLIGDRVGVVVALAPKSGAVLALVSSPAYDPNLFAHRMDEEQWRTLIDDPHRPLHNRATRSGYSPGSIFKIVLAAAGLSEKVVDPSDTTYCTGSVRLYNRRFRCWKAGGHGRLDLRGALKHSCDVYFYHLGQKLGIERIADYARRFGLGRATGIDLEDERTGLVPDSGWSRRVRKQPWYPGETISVAIGQGPLTVTPMQMATMMAGVANGGWLPSPHLVLDPDREARTQPIGADPRAMELIRQALSAVVNETGGTGHNAYLPYLEVAGKTGTVQVVTQKTWTKNKDLPEHLRDHAWFVSFAPAANPELVVAVFLEHGGAGSEMAAPVAKGIYEYYFRNLRPVDPLELALGG
jgi:penicillin-binding protein 2